MLLRVAKEVLYNNMRCFLSDCVILEHLFSYPSYCISVYLHPLSLLLLHQFLLLIPLLSPSGREKEKIFGSSHSMTLLGLFLS